MKIPNLVGHGLETDNSTILNVWEYEEAEAIESIVSDNIDHVTYNNSDNSLYMNNNYIPLSVKPPPSIKVNYQLVSIKAHTYYYNT